MKLTPKKITELLERWQPLLKDDKDWVWGLEYSERGGWITVDGDMNNQHLLAIITSAKLDELAEKAYRAGWYLGIHGPMKAMGDNSEWNIRFQYNGAKKGLVVNVKAPTKDEAVLMACEAMKEASDGD